MTNDILIEKILTKAKENGFSYTYLFSNMLPCDEGDLIKYDNDYEMFAECGILINSIIFSHEFAKAFFGEKTEYHPFFSQNHPCNNNNVSWEFVISWVYHLQQMVLEKEPLKYLEKFL